MSFEFSIDDRSVQSAIRRMGADECAAARRRLAEGAGLDIAALVHAQRRQAKKLRGLVSLFGSGFSGGLAEGPAITAELKAGARRLAPLRDAQVRLDTLALLTARTPGAAHPGLKAALAAELAAQQAPELLAPLLEDQRARLGRLEAGLGGWQVEGRGFEALGEGLAGIWRAARAGRRAASRAAAEGLGTTPFHGWRKAVKHHWYHARLLEPIWPEAMAPHIAATGRLASDLGLLNDLDGFVEHLAEAPDAALARLAINGPLAETIHAMRHELARRAVLQGRRIFAEKPGALVARWRVWWQVWEREGWR